MSSSKCTTLSAWTTPAGPFLLRRHLWKPSTGGHAAENGKTWGNVLDRPTTKPQTQPKWQLKAWRTTYVAIDFQSIMDVSSLQWCEPLPNCDANAIFPRSPIWIWTWLLVFPPSTSGGFTITSRPKFCIWYAVGNWIQSPCCWCMQLYIYIYVPYMYTCWLTTHFQFICPNGTERRPTIPKKKQIE